MEHPVRDNPDGDNSTSGWFPFVKYPYSTEQRFRTSVPPPNLAQEQADWTALYVRKARSSFDNV